jgi:hypothetical protein
MKRFFATSLLATLLLAATSFAYARPSVLGAVGPAGTVLTGAIIQQQLMPDRGHTRQGDN